MMERPPGNLKVLLVDDELTMVQMVSGLLREAGHEVFPFTNGQTAAAALSANAPELVITDLYFDKTRPHGLEILKKARELDPPAVVIVITGFGSIDTAKEAMKNGAFDYLEKPFKVDEFKLCVQRALSYNAALSESAETGVTLLNLQTGDWIDVRPGTKERSLGWFVEEFGASLTRAILDKNIVVPDGITSR